jgi:hypothetical protein
VDDCVQFPNEKAPEDAYGDFADGRYGFLMTLREVFNPPIPAKGHQGVWDWVQQPKSGERGTKWLNRSQKEMTELTRKRMRNIAE